MKNDKVWVFKIYGEKIPSGPYSSKSAAEKDIAVIEARNSSGERNECGEPYQMSRAELKSIVERYIDESLNEAMSEKEKKEFYSRLATDKVHFQYIEKKTGEMRKAYGTLIPEELPPPAKKSDTKQEARDKMRKKKFPSDSVFYYDLGPEPEHKGFRSFKMENFDKYLDDEK